MKMMSRLALLLAGSLALVGPGFAQTAAPSPTARTPGTGSGSVSGQTGYSQGGAGGTGGTGGGPTTSGTAAGAGTATGGTPGGYPDRQ